MRVRGARRRQETAGVLPLLMAVAIIIAIVLLIALGVCGLMVAQGKLHATGEAVGMDTALALNKDDRIGEMNFMVEHSRELVYTSRQSYDAINESYKHVEPLARQLTDESRQGAVMVENERQFLGKQILKEVYSIIDANAEATKKHAEFNLMFFRLNQAGINTLELGTVKDVPCNATCPVAIDELKDFDQQKGLLYGKTNYYKDNIDAPLPAPDHDLRFRFASCAPRVKDTVSSARLINSDDFKLLEVIKEPDRRNRPVLKTLPTAIRMVTKTNIDAPLSMNEDLYLTVTGSAAGSTTEE